MPDEATTTTEYVKNGYEAEDIPAADDLVAGTDYDVGMIEVSGEGEYHRGELMMTGAGGQFVKATSAGLSSAQELCILCEDVGLGDGERGKFYAYFSGKFRGGGVILAEGVKLEDAVEILRRHKIFLV